MRKQSVITLHELAGILRRQADTMARIFQDQAPAPPSATVALRDELYAAINRAMEVAGQYGEDEAQEGVQHGP